MPTSQRANTGHTPANQDSTGQDLALPPPELDKTLWLLTEGRGTEKE